MFKTLSAAQRRPRRWRGARRLPSPAPDPEPAPISRVTVVAANGFADESEAQRWLDSACRDEGEGARETEAALRSVNRAIHAQRLSAADPYVREVSSDHARDVRLGFGTGDEVVEGYWRAAALLPARRRRARRRQMLAPQQELAGILSGRSPAHASEDLALRARLDLDAGRTLQAALQLRAALDALEVELRSQPAGDDAKLASPPERSDLVRAVAAQALREELSEGDRASLTEALEQTEQLLRRRRHRQAR